MTVGPAGTENVYALGDLVQWANRKYEADLQAESLRGRKVTEIRDRLVELSRQWQDGDRLQEAVRQALGSDPTVEKAIAYAAERFEAKLKPEDFDGDVTERVIQAGRRYLRRELTELERFVLLQIYDSSWKDHLLAMDHLKSAIGLRGFAEQDPKVAYKREGARLFEEMMASVEDKVTDMIFKARLVAGEQVQSVYQVSSLVHDQMSGYDNLPREMADQQRAAAPQKVQTIIREQPKVGRNDPCPCGSGKKYKKCCGKNA